MKEIKETTTEEVQEPKFVVLPLELVNGVLGYLGTRPYNESKQLIELIQSEGKVVEDEK